jgi:hypothetical protein
MMILDNSPFTFSHESAGFCYSFCSSVVSDSGRMLVIEINFYINGPSVHFCIIFVYDINMSEHLNKVIF